MMDNTHAIEDAARQPWTVAMVLAWIMWRTAGAVLLHSQSSVFQVQDDELAQADEGNPPRMTAATAITKLWSKLRDGAIKVTALDMQGNSVEVPSHEFFHLDEPDLESHDVLTREFKGDSFRSSRDSSFRLFQRTIYTQPRLRAADVLREFSRECETQNQPDPARSGEATSPSLTTMRPAFQKIRAAIQAEEEATGKPFPVLRAVERNKRLADRMLAQGLNKQEIPSERTFREYFNQGPGKPAKSG